jgi:Tlde1 domain
MWIYEQDTGRLLKNHGEEVATGYAGGNGGAHPEGINNHDMQNVKNVGPIPCGYYTFGEVVLKSHLGPFAIPLIPDSDNEMFGRSAFYMHGDRADPPRSASDGCIIMSRMIRVMCYESNDRILRVKLSGEK